MYIGDTITNIEAADQRPTVVTEYTEFEIPVVAETLIDDFRQALANNSEFQCVLTRKFVGYFPEWREEETPEEVTFQQGQYIYTVRYHQKPVVDREGKKIFQKELVLERDLFEFEGEEIKSISEHASVYLYFDRQSSARAGSPPHEGRFRLILIGSQTNFFYDENNRMTNKQIEEILADLKKG